ncbi:protein kilB [Streptomyces sp. NEAU-H3]|uniref:protein kilB n=1 Tax=Streptomyces sp. NEAU-H3 TaxID=2720636 RepID=UPI00143BC662|nr:protein kilB [Streptomyces sp. NEAU-H3]NJA56274.1 protein kilB [Streptomyces sp. NEAU-H3]
MGASLIAVIGTLLGSVTAYLLQQRGSERTALRRDRLNAVTALTAALADHRRTMWLREDLRLSAAPHDSYEAARAESHATRAAITAPMTTLAILAPSLAETARAAASAVYELRGAADTGALTALREAAILASDRLVEEASKSI